jgi:putative ABC transport system permease protein
MAWHRWQWLVDRVLRRDRARDDLEEELRAHLAIDVQQRIAAGEAPDAARRGARRDLGNELLIKEVTQDGWGFTSLDRVRQDCRYALRSLWRAPAFSIVACAALALGIGSTTIVFTVVHHVLLKPLPFSDPGRLVMIWEQAPKSEQPNVVSLDNFAAWRERNRSFEAMSAFRETPMNLLGGDEPVQVMGAAVTPDFFRVLRVAPLLGRTFTNEDGVPNAAPTIVLSYRFWQERFGGRPDVLGRRVSVNTTHHQIIGVLADGFAFPNARVAAFMALRGVQADGRNYRVIGRLAGDTTLAAAEHEMRALAAVTAIERPLMNADWSATIVPLHEQMVGGSRRALVVLLAAVLLLLLIGCANVANLLLIRSTTRTREIAIRLALGAGRWRLMHQALVEAFVLATVGASAGVALAWWGVGAVRVLADATSALSLPRADEISIDPAVLAFAAVITALTAILFGVVPALSSRRGEFRGLSLGGRAVTPNLRLQSIMVVAEVALALPLLVAAGLLVHSFVRLSQVEPGFRAENVLTVKLLLLPVRDRSSHAALVDDVLDRVRALPQVIAAGSIGRLPMEGGNSGSWYYRADQPEPSLSERPGGDISLITPGYFQAMRIPLVRGRDFDRRDRLGAPPVAIVNQAAARRFFGDQDPLGKRLKVSWNDTREVEIVGVASDIRHSQLQAKPEPCLFLPNSQQPFPFSALVVRTTGNPAALGETVKRAIREVDPDQGVSEVSTMDEIVSTALARPRVQMTLFGLFGLLALALTTLGLYGVLAYSVTQRTREIGMRIAIGSSPMAAFALVLRDGLRLTLPGLALGLCAAFVLTRSMQGLLYEVEPLDPATFTFVTILLMVMATLACAIPAARASRVDPAVVLREE